MKSYSPYQFTIFRIILGFYLSYHFAALLPYAAEIWSKQGLLADPAINLTYGVFPNALYLITSPVGVMLFIAALLLCSLCFMLGFLRPLVAILLWYGWACLFDRNNLINNPGLPYVGWLLLCCAVIPTGEPLSISKSKSEKDWQMPTILFIGAWAIMAIGYTISGFDKFQAPSWRDGSAIFHLLENPLARDWWLRDLMVQLPESFFKLKTWSVLFIEMAFLPLALWKPTRKWIWLAMILMHLGILMIVDFADLTLGMLMIHWFTFDSSWLKAKPKHHGIVFFDGVCNVCNSIINFFISEDHKSSLRYASLQGETAKETLPASFLEDLNTIVFKTDEKTYKESDAVIRSVASMGGIWKVGLVFLIIPRFIRDGVYAFIAKNRYKWFGKKDVCRMPTPEDKDRLLP